MALLRGAPRRLVPAVIALCALLAGPAQLAEAAFVGLPALPVNACSNSSLPKDFGTNYPVPADPFGFGFADQSILGWEENTYAPITYLSGSFFARGVPTTFTAGSSSFCGAMFSFGVYTFGLASGQAPAPGSVQWTMASGFLPALTTSFTRSNVAISIQNFADKVTIGSGAFELLYSRVSLTNNGGGAVTIDPAPTGPNRAVLANPSNTLQPGQSANHDYVVAVDNFGSGQALPSAATLQSSAPAYDTAFGQMSAHWNGLLAVTPAFTLPNLTLPNTNSLANPGAAMVNAYKATFVYTRIIQVSKAPFSGANNYDWLLNHDVPGILVNRFAQGDFTDAQNLLLVGRISEQPNFNEQGANWYFDGIWKTPWAWAVYLEHTNDTAFVSQFFHDDASGSSPWGPSLFTMFHTIYPGQLSNGFLKQSFDNDSTGVWLFDDSSALMGLASYKYIATRIGNAAEATFADQQMTSLMNAVNSALATNQSANGFNWLPCEVTRPNTANRCNNATDANWGGNSFFGQNGWDAFLMGARLNGILGDPAQIDSTYDMGYGRLQGVLPFPTTGAFNGFSTAYLTSYASGGLMSSRHRDLALTAYAWQIATTTGGPNAWWEANGSAPNPNNPWAGSHAPPQFGAIPYAWPQAAQGLALLEAIAAEGVAAAPDGSGGFTYTRPLWIGRGVPDAWVQPGQTIGVSNLTNALDTSSGARTTYGVSIAVSKPATQRVLTVTLSGTLPGGAALVQLPIFASVGVAGVTGGTLDASGSTVTMNAGAPQAVITLKDGGAAGPVTLYHFDETSGTTAADASGGGRTATLVNGATFAAGRVGNAVSLSGTNQHVAMPTGVVGGLNDFTIATWVNETSTSAWRRVFDFGTGTTANMFLTPQSGSGTIRFAITTSGAGGEQRIDGTSALSTGAWHHVAVTLSGGVGILYVDGVEVGRNSAMTLKPSSLGSTTQNWIGRSQYTADPFLAGKVDEFRIYNRALSAAEVQALFQNP
ncbi:MAG TPA: LamG domain-containing protein [Candidatus Dormibacteraeota bacterium]|nr:LamG domain-containing protein [Candidatus Dormibacteraeota bacterium]